MASSLRLHVPLTLSPQQTCALPDAAVRHVQVRRLQPGDGLSVFDGRGSEWAAELLSIGRQQASVRILQALPVVPEVATPVCLAVGMPANERMDTLVEKAAELGVAAIQPLVTERGVLRLSGERAQRRQAHWQAVAASACEQCGRATVPEVRPVLALGPWLGGLAADGAARLLLSPHAAPVPLAAVSLSATGAIVLSGPEGGLSGDEEAAAGAAGFQAVSLGPRVLRADTAPLAAMAWFALRLPGR